MAEVQPKSTAQWDFKDDMQYFYKAQEGLDEDIIKQLSKDKEEPEWMLDVRLKAYKKFLELKLPSWGPNLDDINYDEITYYAKAADVEANKWEDVPENIKNTFEKLGIPEAERKILGGVSAQYESNVLYHSIQKKLADQGVVFASMDWGLKHYPELVKRYFSKLVPYADNKFAALNTALWSGGSFLYVPKGVKVERPLQAYFRINLSGFGQFERTLIVVDEDAEASYVEGCSAPAYSKLSLHAAVVEVFALANSRVRYTTIQNWSKNVYNLVTKRSIAQENAYVEWLDGNMGSKVTQKYPCIILAGKNARGKVISIAYAGKDQIIDSGAKAIHLAENTSSTIISKSISGWGGQTSYRGLVNIAPGAKNAKTSVVCDALILDSNSRSDTYPNIHVAEKEATIAHEATVGKISEEQLFYLANRGLNEEDAKTMVVMGFLDEFTKELPLEYAIELNRLIKLDMTDSVG